MGRSTFSMRLDVVGRGDDHRAPACAVVTRRGVDRVGLDVCVGNVVRVERESVRGRGGPPWDVDQYSADGGHQVGSGISEERARVRRDVHERHDHVALRVGRLHRSADHRLVAVGTLADRLRAWRGCGRRGHVTVAVLGAADGDDATGVVWGAEHPAIKPTVRKGSIRFMFRSVKCGRGSRGRSLNRLQNPPWRILGLASRFSSRAEPRL